MTPSRESMTLSSSVPSSPSQLEELDSPFTTFAHPDPISEEQTESQMDSYQCSRSSMTLPDMLIRVVARERVHLLSTSSHGIQTFSNFCSSKRTLVQKRIVPETCFMPCGFLISLWREWRPTPSGLFSARMRLQDCATCTGKNSSNCTKNMRRLDCRGVRFVPESSGLPLWSHKSRLELHICSTRTRATKSQIKKIWARFVRPTCAPRSFSTRPTRRSQCATWHPLLFQCT
mmetsp:Transcript_9681/g.35924  ORF Transcript_9681/g.35924 Transcript_9681/m.35924 type:complete len:231 (+) Transcript_9681:747-1439(+)